MYGLSLTYLLGGEGPDAWSPFSSAVARSTNSASSVSRVVLFRISSTSSFSDDISIVVGVLLLGASASAIRSYSSQPLGSSQCLKWPIVTKSSA